MKEASNHNNLSGRLLCLKVFIPLSLILFGWSWLDIWYYGVRYKQGCHPYDLWATYFTSSDYVAIQRWLYGEPDVIEVRRTFQTQKEARDWEIKVLRRMKVIKSERWLNKTDVKSIAPQYGNQNAKNGKGKRRTEEQKRNIANGQIGNNNGSGNLGKKRTEEQKSKMRKPRSDQGKKNMLGIRKTDLHRQKLKEAWNDNRKDNQSKKFSGEGNPMFGRTSKDNPMFGKVTVFDKDIQKIINIEKELYYNNKGRYITTTSSEYKNRSKNENI